MNQVSCSACNIVLEIPNELMGGQVRCSSCMNVFTAELKEVFSPQLDRSENQDNPEITQPRSKPSRAWLWVLLSGCAIIALVCFGGCLGIVSGWTNPKLSRHESADGFAGIFPQKPLPVFKKDFTGHDLKGWEAKRDFPEETYFVLFSEPEEGEKEDKRTPMQAVQDWVKQNSGRSMQTDTVSHQDYPASQATGQLSFTQGNFVVRAIKVDKRMYVIGIFGGVMPNTNYTNRFLDSFEPKIKSDAAKNKENQ